MQQTQLLQNTNELVLKHLKYLSQNNLTKNNNQLQLVISNLQEILNMQPQPSSELLDIIYCNQQKLLSEQYKDQGNSAMKAQDYTQAILQYTQAIDQSILLSESKQLRSVYYANRASALKNLNKVQDGINDLKIAIELDPGYEKAWLRLAQFYEHINNYQSAHNIYLKQNTLKQSETTLDGIDRTSKIIRKAEIIKLFPVLGQEQDPKINELLQRQSVYNKLIMIKDIANPMEQFENDEIFPILVILYPEQVKWYDHLDEIADEVKGVFKDLFKKK
ncbi:Small_glutamine-rich tetratricopeptide repeat-containing protein [Hexamita inflata]|uniref:Small glutamine-rich tetratricopeptide repeat-containing protein n=1 Tax=Hexamita inflata TaxID=28002 RepID=A0AA86PEA0_9EUKA|nr:Small glutamine-rich tetratricopeptide repeat-containing protein [Hexamita inflata]